MLSLPVPVHLLDAGALPAAAKWYWHALRRAQLHEVEATFGPARAVSSIRAIDELTVPGVLVIPVLAGGCASKRDWWPLRAAMRRWRQKGGVTVVLGCAFCLAEEGEKARGRNFEGIYTSGNSNWLGPPVSFTVVNSPAAALGTGFSTDHAYEGSDERIEILAEAATASERRPLVIRYTDHGADFPGAILFISTWSWVRKQLLENPRSATAKGDRAATEATFDALRAVNRAAVAGTLATVQSRIAQRLARLQALSGEEERLSRNMGAERDYQRLLANDVALCVDVIAWRGLIGDDAVSQDFLRQFSASWIWAEPPHHKAAKARGRLDLLLLPAEQGPIEYTLASLEEWLGTAGRGRVAWVELEAGPMNVGQMATFLKENAHLIGDGDFVVAIDRSLDADAAVQGVAASVAALNARFLHVQVPNVFNRLEEHYAPLLHRTSRKRFTTEVIRGLIG